MPSIYHYYYQFLIIMISKKIFACRFEYIMKQGTIKINSFLLHAMLVS